MIVQSAGGGNAQFPSQSPSQFKTTRMPSMHQFAMLKLTDNFSQRLKITPQRIPFCLQRYYGPS